MVGVHAGRPVYLRDVAVIIDTGQEPADYVLQVGPTGDLEPAVTLSVAKRPGANAIDVVDQVLAKVEELRGLVIWSEGMVWCSPERHGAMTGIMKAQIDWIPLTLGAVRPTQGKTLAVMQVSGGSQSFNAVNQLRILGRWMRMIAIPNQSSVAKAFLEFEENGRMKPSPYYNRMVDVMEELMKFTVLTRGRSAYLTDRYSERVESVEELSRRVNLKSI